MDLELSDEEAALRDNVRVVLEGISPPSVARLVHDGEAPPPKLWQQMVELGWPALAIAESRGGLGMGFVEQVLVAEELGRSVTPSPLLATATQFVPAVAEMGAGEVVERFLRPVAEDGHTGTLALAERGRWDTAAVTTTARRSAAGWRLHGEKSAVLDGGTADHLVVIARAEAGIGAFVVPGESVEVAHRRPLDPTLPLADLRLDGVEVGPECVLAEPGSPGVEDALDRAVEQATTAVAAMTVGVCRRILETTVAYTKVREQFGRPIGSFQALKHRMFEMYLAVERATALVYVAAATIAEDADGRAVAVAAAKAAAGDCQQRVAEDGLQLHGGIGFTWEEDLHLLLKRAKVGEVLFGGAITHRARLATILGFGTGAGADAA